MHVKNVYTKGKSVEEVQKALILLHGRGAGARDILELARHLHVDEFALIAPQATNNTWYPYSFLVPPAKNEPWLSSALALVKELLDEVKAQGIPAENIYFAGFSQGACLTLEFVCRHATRYGGIAAFTGGLIGDKINEENYSGDFAGTPVLISSGNPDPHIPVDRIEESVEVLEKMNAKVDKRIFVNRPHIITNEEIDLANELIFGKKI